MPDSSKIHCKYFEGRIATEIGVADMRLILQLPLLPPKDGSEMSAANLKKAGWKHVPDPLSLLDMGVDDHPSELSPKPYSDHAYQEFLYFHDFVQDFLYPFTEKLSERSSIGVSAQRLFRRVDLSALKATIKGRVWRFDIERHTLQFFKTGVAMLTVELHIAQTDSGLTLADTQTIIDHLRRNFVAFWDVNGQPDRVPDSVVLYDREGLPVRAYTARSKNCSLERFNRDRRPDMFPHWEEWAKPLNVGGSPDAWRDPNDERVPVLSFIQIEQRPGESNRETLAQIRHGDWIRLADAEESDSAIAPYNPEFIAKEHPEYFYDRFHGDPLMHDYLATRHLFGGAHYAMVSTGSSPVMFLSTIFGVTTPTSLSSRGSNTPRC